MSLRPGIFPATPEESVRVARASFPKGSRYTRLCDELGAMFDDAQFAGLFPARGRPAEAPWRRALVTLFQFAEGLPDRQTAEAVRGRIDWKHALALRLSDPGFDGAVLSEFRSRLAAARALNRLECAIETTRHALESLAVAAPDWLRAHAEPDWADRLAARAATRGVAADWRRGCDAAVTRVEQDKEAALVASLARRLPPLSAAAALGKLRALPRP